MSTSYSETDSDSGSKPTPKPTPLRRLPLSRLKSSQPSTSPTSPTKKTWTFDSFSKWVIFATPWFCNPCCAKSSFFNTTSCITSDIISDKISPEDQTRLLNLTGSEDNFHDWAVALNSSIFALIPLEHDSPEQSTSISTLVLANAHLQAVIEVTAKRGKRNLADNPIKPIVPRLRVLSELMDRLINEYGGFRLAWSRALEQIPEDSEKTGNR
ncbi:hypothetical protein BELL_0653g00050 [Botrytis elliptica]|uniref:Uncharacterized protein n=1 Tax=Botrytis elliptica TaxID=278938 RepID=A0A4Z1JHV7_9HELO|nr:hypothetical protein BELL_0653g00050 [Botrytis elliptica]